MVAGIVRDQVICPTGKSLSLSRISPHSKRAARGKIACADKLISCGDSGCSASSAAAARKFLFMKIVICEHTARIPPGKRALERDGIFSILNSQLSSP
jgi:hypothetical protein